MMMRWLPGLTLLLLLAGCVPNNVRDDPAVFDFGEMTGTWQGPGLRGIAVVAPSWLDTPAMQYRLKASEPSRRRVYTESRWAAPPAELIEQTLRRRALVSAGAGGAALDCRLRIDLDELVQVFDSAQASHVVLAARATLVSHGRQPLARRAFEIERAAPSADARGGVAAATAAVQALAGQLSAWIVDEKSALAPRCRE